MEKFKRHFNPNVFYSLVKKRLHNKKGEATEPSLNSLLGAHLLNEHAGPWAQRTCGKRVLALEKTTLRLETEQKENKGNRHADRSRTRWERGDAPASPRLTGPPIAGHSGLQGCLP